MRVPDILYRLSRAPGALGPLVELFVRRQETSASATSVSSAITGVPKDKILIVTNLSMDLSPGAAQQIIRCVMSGRTPGGQVFAIKQLGFTEVDAFRTGMNWQGEVSIGGGGTDASILLFDSVWDGGANANQQVVSVFGYVIPRGNVAPF